MSKTFSHNTSQLPKRFWRRWFCTIGLLIIVAGGGLVLKVGLFGKNYSITPDATKYPVRGVDLSAHNGDVDFNALRASGISFVMLKASEGATHQDKRFVENVRNARKAGLKVGAYHFFRFDVPGHMQALNFLNAVRGRQLDLPIAVDVETWRNSTNIDRKEVVESLTEMVDYLESRGYRVMLYTNKEGSVAYVSGSRLQELPLWICSFTDPPVADTIQWQLWQHSHRGKVDGVIGAVDLNTFNGGRNAFERFTEDNAAVSVQ